MEKHNLRLMKYLFKKRRAKYYSKDKIQKYMEEMSNKKIQQSIEKGQKPSEESIKEFLEKEKNDESIKIMLIDLTSIFIEHTYVGYPDVFRWKDNYDNKWNVFGDKNGTVYEYNNEYVRFRKSNYNLNVGAKEVHYFLQYYICEIIEDFKKNWDKYKGSFEFFCSLFDNDARRDLHRKYVKIKNATWDIEMAKILYNKEMREEDQAARLKKIEEERKENERIKTMNKIFEDLEKAKKKKTEHENIRCASKKQKRKINCENKQGILNKWNRKIDELEKEWNKRAKSDEGPPQHIPQSKFYHISRLKF